jgi:hypothetical protein
MKFSIVATALLAQGIAAMPWTSVKSQSNGEEITYALFSKSQNPIFTLSFYVHCAVY